MTGMTRSSAGLSGRQRKALYRAWHRGMRETDLLLGSFADAEISNLDNSELAIFEHLLDQPDAEILGWLTGSCETPAEFDTPLLQRIRNYHPDGQDR
ncbi:MAG: succinate dehydrogenase assembly factor 2 [Rhizobiaceae bacterium]